MYRAEMDLQTMQIPLIFVAIFVFAVLLLSFVYKYGMKEKSYEEAIAEQRLNAQTLLGIKQKPKDKKIKKTAKKSKDKEKANKPGPEDKRSEKIENEEKESETPQNESESDPNESPKINQDVKKSVKASKTQKSKIDENARTDINPQVKEDNSKSKNEGKSSGKIPNIKKENDSLKDTEKKTILKKEVVTDNKKDEKKEKPTVNKEPSKEKIVLKKDDKKEKIKDEVDGEVKKEETKEKIPNHKQKHVTIDPEKKEIIPETKKSVNKSNLTNGYVVNTISEKKKKKNDFNADYLFNNVETAGISVILNLIRQAEISRSDLQVLIDFLLNKQHDAPETIDEWSEGKYDPIQKLKKQLAEKEKALQDEQEMVQGVQIKLKEIRQEQLTERSAFNQKFKYLEEQLRDKQMEIQGLNNRLQNHTQLLQQVQVLREELANMQMQRQQLEMHIAQESEVLVAQLRSQVQDLSTRNEQLVIDITHFQKIGADSEQSFLNQLANFKKELDQKNRQLEDLLREKSNYDMIARMETDLKNELSHVNNLLMQTSDELRRQQEIAAEKDEQINTLVKQKNISTKLIDKLKSEIEKLQEEKAQSLESIENNKIHETDILNLKNELTSLKSQLEEQEGKHMAEIESKLSLVKKLECELDDQKSKNNELRNKNHTVVEALNVAETRLKSNADNAVDVEKLKSEIKLAELEAQKKFLKRLFPEITNLDDLSNDNWEEESAKLINLHISLLKETTKDIEEKLKEYEKSLKDQEQKLNNFQTQQQEEELSWKQQIKTKDFELQELKQKLEQVQVETINGSAEGEQ